jgi:hypothetical protein
MTSNSSLSTTASSAARVEVEVMPITAEAIREYLKPFD